VIYIQTNVKSRIGCGTPIVVKFYAPLDHLNPDAEIVYDFKSFGSEIDLIRNGDDYTYCLVQCYKMCYYIQKMHQTEVLKMKVEFTKDENGSVRLWKKLISIDLVNLRVRDRLALMQGQGAHSALLKLN